MAQDIIDGINPTRMELLSLKNRTKLAVKGHGLLKEKRDALIKEFFDILDRVKGIRENAEKSLSEANEALLEEYHYIEHYASNFHNILYNSHKHKKGHQDDIHPSTLRMYIDQYSLVNSSYLNFICVITLAHGNTRGNHSNITLFH